MSNKKEMKDLVPSLETCKKFQELGLCGKSVFCYIENERFPEFENQPIFRGNLNESDAMLPSIYDIIAPAPTTDEIMAELPRFYTVQSLTLEYYFFYIMKHDKENYSTGYKDQMGSGVFNAIGDKLPNLLADLLLKLKLANLLPL